MLTWLDWYISGARDRLLAGAGGLLAEAPADDRAAMELLALAELGQVRPAGDGEPGVRALLMAALLPFMAADPARLRWMAGEHTTGATTWTQPYGVKLSARLVADLADARPPATDDYWPELRRRTWYLDIPHRALMLDEERQIRAIFVQPSSAGQSVLLVAVLTQPSQEEIHARAAWLLAPAGGAVEEEPLVETPTPLDDAALRQRVNDFVALVMLYRLTARPDETRTLPHIDADQLARLASDKKRRAAARTRSLFRVVELDSPADRFGRPAEARPESGGGWRLDHRVRVRGHFRWQPWGPGHSLRRLQWIAAHHRGPEDAPERVDLERR